MPSTPNPGPSNPWPDAPATSPVPHDDDRSTGTADAPARDAHAPRPPRLDTPPDDEGTTHRPPLPPGQIPAAWLPRETLADEASSPDHPAPRPPRTPPAAPVLGAPRPNPPFGSPAPQPDPSAPADANTGSTQTGSSSTQTGPGPADSYPGQPGSYPGQPGSHPGQGGPDPAPGGPSYPDGSGGRSDLPGSPSVPLGPPGSAPGWIDPRTGRPYPQPGQPDSSAAQPYPQPGLAYPQPGQPDPSAAQAYPQPGQAGPQSGPAGSYPGPDGPGGQFPPNAQFPPNTQFPPGQQFPPGAWFQGQYPPGGPQGPHPQNGNWNLPERKRKSPDELKVVALRTRDRLRLFMVMVIGLLIVSQLALPFRLAGIALGLAAAFVGVKVLIGLAEMHRGGLGARGIVFTLFGLGLTGMLLLVLVSQAVYYPVVSELEECQSRANTESAAEACVDATNDRFNNILEDLNQRARNT